MSRTTYLRESQGHYKQALRKFQRDYFGMMLATNGGSVTRVAAQAGINRTHLYRILWSLGLKAMPVQSNGTRPSNLKTGTVSFHTSVNDAA